MLNRGVWVVVAVLAASCQPEMRVPDTCAGIDCGEGQCAVLNGAAACLCNDGYRATGLTCAAIDLCASRPCEGLTNSLCLVADGAVSCVCPEGRVAIGGSCVVKTACTPNPCTTARRTTCEVVGGVAECRCDPGYTPEGTGCSAVPLWTCADQHAGDAFEPDECPTVAHPMPSEQAELHSIAPAGDHDWYAISAPAGKLMRFAAASSGLNLLIEVYDASGTTLLASDNTGSVEASANFVMPASGRAMVRVRALRVSDTGEYVAALTVLGVDDYANSTVDAVTLVPSPTGFVGEVQYAGDLDVVKLELPARTAVSLARPDGGVSNLVIELARADGGTRVLEQGERTVVTVPAVENVVVTARGRSIRNVGAFSLAIEDLGLDDHAEDPLFATPLLTGPAPTTGVIERSTDIDAFRIGQQVGRIYSVTWNSSSSSSVSATLFDSNNVVIGNPQVWGTQNITWAANRSTPATLRVQSSYSVAGATYSVTLEDLGFDDHPDELGNATPLTVGTAATGRLELSTDIDTFSFTAVAGRVMLATVSTTGVSSALLRLRVYAPDGTLAGEADGSVGLLAASTGTYKVQVTRQYSSGAVLTPYQVTVSDNGADDHGNLRASATPLTLGMSVSGSVQYAADLDVFSFTAVANHVYGVSCTRGTTVCSFRVLDASGQPVPSSANVSAVLATTSGTWSVELSGGQYASTLGAYTLAVTDLGVEDHGATQATATALTPGTAGVGRLDFVSDVDVFSFPAVVDHIYRVTVTGASSPSLEVRTAGNLQVASSNYSSAVSFVAPSTATLFVSLSSYSSYSTSSGYTLNVEDVGTDDHGGTVATATPITLGAATAGSVQYRNDVDLFSVSVTPGRHHRVQCTARVGTCGIAVESGSTTLASVYATTNASVAFTPQSSVTSVIVRITSSNDPSSYELTVADLGADDHGDTLADATTIVLDAPAVTGANLVESDADVFKLNLAANEIVAFNCTTTAGNTCALSVFGPLGNISSVSAAASTSIAVLATTSGTYRVEVRPGYSSPNSAYTIAAVRGQDDVTTVTPLTLNTPRSGAIDYVGDVDVFSLSLTAGSMVRVTLAGSARAQVYSPANGYVTNVYSGSSSQFTAATTGTYTFSVTADFGRPVGAYSITVQ